jgi:ribosomal protein S18 acetylase RimI-like enzyme
MSAGQLSVREIKCVENDLKMLQTFVANAGDSLKTFRYFATREVSVIGGHVLTVLLLDDGMPVGYGHLDPEGDAVWLGICLAAASRGRGYGRTIMEYLVESARRMGIPEIDLKVDADNSPAISLYRDFGFEVTRESPDAYFMKRIVAAS